MLKGCIAQCLSLIQLHRHNVHTKFNNEQLNIVALFPLAAYDCIGTAQA